MFVVPDSIALGLIGGNKAVLIYFQFIDLRENS
jgi:hypothetical protein